MCVYKAVRRLACFCVLSFEARGRGVHNCGVRPVGEGSRRLGGGTPQAQLWKTAFSLPGRGSCVGPCAELLKTKTVFIPGGSWVPKNGPRGPSQVLGPEKQSLRETRNWPAFLSQGCGAEEARGSGKIPAQVGTLPGIPPRPRRLLSPRRFPQAPGVAAAVLTPSLALSLFRAEQEGAKECGVHMPGGGNGCVCVRENVAREGVTT